MEEPTLSLGELRERVNGLEARHPGGAKILLNAPDALALIDIAEAARDAAQIDDDLQRIRGIADADGGRLLGDYGFTTLRDALFDISRKHDRLRDALARVRP